MNPWRPVPLLRLIIPFITGIITGQSLNSQLPAWIPTILLFSACVGLILVQRFLLNFRYSLLRGFLVLFSFFISGLQFATINPEARQSNMPEFDKPAVFLIRISECPVIKRGFSCTVAEMVSLFDSGKWEPGHWKLYIRIFGGNEWGELSYGNYYLLKGRPERLVFFTNNHSFNFRKYLSGKGISYELSCRACNCIQICGEHAKGIPFLAFRARDKLLHILKVNGLSGQEYSVAAALLLGYVSEIDNHLKSAYAASGTMHILSVSGMHVGIIFLFLETLLSFLEKPKHGRYLKSFLQILFIWAYAAITGFSPAVLRAAACLSFLIAGKTMKRKPGMLNVISASVFFLLLSDPLILRDIGFQLSYLAVTGIVIFYKPIYDLYVTHRWLPDKVWGFVAVSIAAQVSTFPLSLYYFHRFPNYFILSNLIIVPLSNGIILMGVLTLGLSPLPILGRLAMSALNLLLSLLNKSVLWIASLPGSLSSGFYPGITTTCLLYMLIFSIFAFLTMKQTKFMLISLSCLILLGITNLTEKQILSRQRKLAIHQGREGYVIRFDRGRKEICFYSCLRMMKDPFITDQIGNEQAAGRVSSVRERWVNFTGWQRNIGFPETGRFGNMIVTGGKKVYILDRSIDKKLNVKVHVDILLLYGNVNYSMLQLRSIFTPQCILNVSAASRSRVLKWSDQARICGLMFYDLKTTGFYQQEF